LIFIITHAAGRHSFVSVQERGGGGDGGHEPQLGTRERVASSPKKYFLLFYSSFSSSSHTWGTSLSFSPFFFNYIFPVSSV
jgi:hypothetical protein